MDLTAIITIITVLIGGGGIGAMITAIATRRKIEADTTQIFTSSMKELLTEYRQQNDEQQAEIVKLKDRVKHLENEQIAQEAAIENLNAKHLKLELAFVINNLDVRRRGHKPVLELAELEKHTIEDLRTIADTMRHIEDRRGGKAGND